MIKKTCPNGHVYDQSIYGDVCPLCPSGAPHHTGAGVPPVPPQPGNGPHTRIVNPQPQPGNIGNPKPQNDPTGSTHVNQNFQQKPQARQQNPQATTSSPKTTIRRNPAMMGSAKVNEEGRKLVGFLVTYNRTPFGKAYNLYEGRNYIGRDAVCDISVPDDNQMSGKHMLIRYLSGNNKFSFKDEMSSNGTYVNKELIDEGELHNYDIIRVGSTLFIFMAIPQI